MKWAHDLARRLQVFIEFFGTFQCPFHEYFRQAIDL